MPPFQQVSQISALLELPQSTVRAVSTITVRPELHEMGFHGRAATYKPKITIRDDKLWLEWCKADRHWTLEQWKRVLWSDESCFTIWQSKG